MRSLPPPLPLSSPSTFFLLPLFFHHLPRTNHMFVHSVSVLQWLCNADSTAHSPAGRLLRFFTDLFGCLRKGSRAVFQFYPEGDEQIKFIMGQATRAGFGGGLCVDYVRSLWFPLLVEPSSSRTDSFFTAAQLVEEARSPHPLSLSSLRHRLTLTPPRRKKFYLILFAGQPIVGGKPQPIAVPQGLTEEGTVAYEKKRAKDTRKTLSRGSKKGRKGAQGDETSKEWVKRKKELYKLRGKEGVPRDSKCVVFSFFLFPFLFSSPCPRLPLRHSFVSLSSC